MHIRRISFAGARTDRLDAMADFVRDVLGLAPQYRDDGWAVFQLESGERDFLEVYRPGHYDERLMPSEAGGLMISFEVDDLEGARAELIAAGIEIVGDTLWAAELFGNPQYEGFGWLFFRAPDGIVYAMQQGSAPSVSGNRGDA